MPASSSQTRTRRQHLPTKVTGIYYSLHKNGSKTFECRYTNSEGKRVFETCGSFESAKSRLAEVTGKVSKGGVVKDTSRTVASLIGDWEEVRDVKPRTRETQDSHVRLYIRKPLGRLKVRDVTRAVVLKWLVGLKRQDGTEPLSDGTRALILATLSSILDHAVESELIAVNPCKTLGRRQKPHQGTIEARILGPGELEALLAASERFPWLRDCISASLYAGLRLGEVCGLKWSDVDLDGNTITVRRQLGKGGVFGSPKGGESATIPLLPELKKTLLPLYLAAEDKSPGGPVFYNTLGGHRQPRDVQRAFEKARRYAKLSPEPRALRFHDLRHTSISRLANAPGAVLPQVQNFARHATLATTLGYVHLIESATWNESAALALAGLTS